MIINGKLIRVLLWGLCMTLLTACSDDTPEGDLEGSAFDALRGSMTVSLRIGIESVDGGKGLSRADTDDPYTGPYGRDDRYATGTTYENTIHRLTLFVQDLGKDGKGGEIRAYNIGSEYPFLPFVGNSENRYLYLAKQRLDNVKFGKKRIYAAANLSDKQIEEFRTGGPDGSYSLPGRELTIGNDLASDNGGMAMFCTQPVEPEFEYDGDNTEVECTFHLRRIAAKVLVTVVTDKDGFANTGKADEENPSFKVKLASVSYVVNSLNTSTYLFQHISGNTVEDPNYDLAQDPDDAFVNHSMESWVNYSHFFQPTPRYEEDRVPGNGSAENVYTEGIYCPENTFGSAGELPENGERQITHVIIRAKLVPLKLGILKDLVVFIQNSYQGDNTTLVDRLEKAKEDTGEDALFFFQCKNQEESELIREYSLKYEEYDGLTEQAFFCDKDGLFYTYAAAKYKELGENYTKGEGNTTKFKNMEIHARGYAYYWTYLRNSETGGGENSNVWTDSQVYRNTYYILHVDRFVEPGSGVDPNKKYIDVHTEVLPFRQSWSSKVSIGEEE